MQNIYSHLTAKERNTMSFPSKYLLEHGMLNGKILDYGCGFGKDVELLKNIGKEIIGYDPFYFPNFPIGKYDTIICLYVLNVLQTEEQSNVLMAISQLLRPGGKAFFAVRRDVEHEGFRLHKIHRQHTFQCNVKLNFQTVFRNESCEIYEFMHYNFVKKSENLSCPFCLPDIEREIILESATAYSIYDKFPVSNGHVLVIPKKHCGSYFELSFREQTACMYMLNKIKAIVDDKHNPQGYNIGINVNSTAGQTVPHVHIHLIPRYENDVENPIGGVRNIIPGKGNYLGNNEF